MPHCTGSMARHEGFALLGWSCPEGWNFTLGEENPLSSSGEGAKEGRAAGFSYSSKEIRLKSPTFDLPRLQRKPGSRTRVWFRAQK